ncbi:hypothetical protein GCM10011610_49430 [Nocardia rhizosphaerihabitans]|uniref:Uncharacterized protein n=1 Tax=Nocardia rhizosphaerihabitans TaxID=1691570 RepID=A0ABQ2KTZ9_9NOCA|nr:hypothetical protein GCM10011610_49430 [Nocardia rhizosphaerihabitans]
MPIGYSGDGTAPASTSSGSPSTCSLRSPGAICGAVLANIMFDLGAWQISTNDRITNGHLVGEVVATAG